jgi:hypothetical protein
MKSGTCPKCGGQHVVGDLNLRQVDRTVPNKNLVITMYEPSSRVPTSYHETKAYVCGACGHVELYVDDPNAVWHNRAAGHR